MKPETKSVVSGDKLIAVIRIRGNVRVRENIRKTLNMMNLHKKNWCVVLRNTASNLGMINKVKDYCTFGEIDNAVFSKLMEKRAKIAGNKPLTLAYLKEQSKLDFEEFANKLTKGEIIFKSIPGAKSYFKLKPPIGGFEKGGTRVSYSSGGALGYRRTEISKLINKML